MGRAAADEQRWARRARSEVERLVVLDDDVYIRLGNRAGARVEGNAEKPYVKIRIADEEFDRVLLEDSSDQAGKVAELMGEKYWSDIFIKYVDHPYTLKLIPEE